MMPDFIRLRSRTASLLLPLLALLIAFTACAPTGTPAPSVTPEELGELVPADWEYTLRGETATGDSGMVVSDEPHATRVGVDILRAGGNAVDAAVATAFALAVVYPEAGNIGGGGFMVRRSADGEAAALDFREKAPAAATADMFLGEDGEVTDQSLVGHLASGVPGAVMGLWTAHERYGALPWEDLIAPAIRLAEEGFEVNERFASTVAGRSDKLTRFPGSAELFYPDGEPIAEGSTWTNPDLAATLRRIAEQGPDGFYTGETADLIVAEMESGGGLITHEDLEEYTAAWREPVVFDYRGYEVVSMPPASSGGITLAIMANILEGYGMRSLGWHSPEALHLTTEAMRRAFADRNHYMGDTDFVDVQREMLTSEEYGSRQRATIDLSRASRSENVEPGLGATTTALGSDGTESDHTTHFSIVDASGTAVALTTTINFLYGSGVTVSGAGFVLNNEMDDFTAKPGEPNAYGLVQGEANAIEPGKRMLSAMTPTILSGAEGPILVTGARGGPRIITAVWQVISNIADYGMPVDLAVRTPRIHHQHLPDRLGYEREGLLPTQVEALEAMGHEVYARGGIGNAPSILWRDGLWHGTADPRSGGLADGY